MKAAKVLFVDDEVNVLNALKRQFRKQYCVSVATSGAEALEFIDREGPFSVIVSDMQMPEMNGVEFLRKAQVLAPDTVRVMLTGNADQKTAMEAVNVGNVFSFYTKPCSQELMASALERAVRQYRLLTAEKELLDGTLRGSVKLLLDMLSMIAPDVFGRTQKTIEMVSDVIAGLAIVDDWNLRISSMLCNIACVTLPPETLKRYIQNLDLSAQEAVMVKHLPEVASNLLSNIPRLEDVSRILRYQNEHFDGRGFPGDDITGDDIPFESRILKIVNDINMSLTHNNTMSQTLKMMSLNRGYYDPDLFRSIASIMAEKLKGSNDEAIINSTLNGLQAGTILADDIVNHDGKLLVAAGNRLSESIIERLFNFNRITPIREPIKVIYEDAGHVYMQQASSQ